MATSLTCIGILWTCFSVCAAVFCCAGFYLPFLIKGQLEHDDTYFGTFRRCNYPLVTAIGVRLIKECGHYTKFSNIPSAWWQICTILIAISCILSVLTAMLAASALCLTYVINNSTARVLGSLQLFSCLLIVSAMALYPLGWDNLEIKAACGDNAGVYNLGACEVSWSLYVLGSVATLLFFCFCLSFCASRFKSRTFGR